MCNLLSPQNTIFGISGKHLFLLSQLQTLLAGPGGGGGGAPAIFITVTKVRVGVEVMMLTMMSRWRAV